MLRENINTQSRNTHGKRLSAGELRGGKVGEWVMRLSHKAKMPFVYRGRTRSTEWLAAGSWWLVAGGWWLAAGWLVAIVLYTHRLHRQHHPRGPAAPLYIWDQIMLQKK